MKKRIILNEQSLSIFGKIFFAAVAAYLNGKLDKNGKETVRSPFKIKGTPEQINALTNAIVTSKEFQKAVSQPGASVEDVMEKLNVKNLAKETFKNLTKKSYPL